MCLSYRLKAADARLLITSESGAAAIDRDELPTLTTVVSIDGPSDHAVSWNDFVYPGKDHFEAVATRADDRVSEAAMEDRKKEGYF